MTTLAPAQVAALTNQYFGDLGPQVVADMTAIALAESGGNAAASNINADTRDDSHGLWQINVRPDANPQYASWNLDDPAQNAKAARAIYDAGGYGPWSTWGNGDALDHWDEAAQAVSGLYSGTGATQPRIPAYKQAIGATIAQGAGSPPMVTQAPGAAPLTVNTGQDITKLYYWVLQQLQNLGTGPSPTTGYYPSELSGGQAGTYSPTLARDQYQAARDDANRNYGLDLQRFGLDYANTAFNQNLAAANQQLQQQQLEVSKQGPGDWLKYNYLINNKVAPPTPTVGGTANPQATVPTVGGVPAPPAGFNPNLAADQAKAKSMSDAYNAGNYSGYQQLGGTAQIPAPAGQQNVTAAVSPPSPTPPDASGRLPDQISADNAQNVAAFGNIPHLAFGGQSAPAPLEGDVMQPGESEFSDVPPPPGGGFIAWLHQLYEADMASQGGSATPGGGMNAAVVGDAQRPGEPNEELAVSASPIQVTPLDQMSPQERQLAQAQQHKATGGLAFGVTGDQPYGAQPFVQKQNQGGAAFTGRGESLGPYGTQPLNFTNYQQLLPSEQAMTRGYIDTPTELGGLGGYSADELARAQRSQYSGISFGTPVGYSA